MLTILFVVSQLQEEKGTLNIFWSS